MNAPNDARQERALACHEMLLRLAGKAPDELVTQAREWLAEGRMGEIARAVAFTAVAQRISMLEDDVMLLDALLSDDNADATGLSQIEIAEYEFMPPFGFTVTQSGEEAPGSEPGAETDAFAQAVMEAIGAETGAHGLWRVWRRPADGSPWPPPKRVFLVEMDEDAELPAVTARLQQAVAAAGESEPQVEVFATGEELPVYQRLARAYGALVWAATPEPDIEIAAVFDEVDARTGPRFRPDHTRIEDDRERQRIIDYLQAGEALLVTTARMDDVVDTARRSSVPMNFRTDGTWIWTDSTTYYLEQHHLEPDTGLLAHITAANFQMPELDGVALHRAMAVLQRPAEEEPVWTFDGSSSAPDEE